MSNYTKSTNFATKDNLPTGDPLKIVKGTEIDTEFNNIATAISTKTDNASAAITGGSITGITDLAIADGGTGASTATAAINNLLPSQTSNANKYLQTDGTNVSWDAISINTGDITGTLPVANGGTGVTSSTGTGSVVLSNSPTLVTPALGTPASGVATNLTGLPLSTGITGLGTGVATALAINTPNTGAIVVNGGALGTPSSGTVTNLTGTASININGTVGSSTAYSGAFTSLTTSSTVTINGGTANGVAYLNGSKVLTTGSVIKFDGTNFTSDRSASTAYSGTNQATWANGIVLNNSATPATGILDSIYFSNNANMQNVFGVAQNSSGYGDFVWAGYSGTYTEWMKLTSSGLTLTSNPTLSGGTANGITYLNGSKVLTSGSALTFDGTNLGVGTAAPTGSGTYRSINAGAALLYGNTSSAIASLNNNGDINDKYIVNGVASSFVQSSGNHLWYTAGSGTAGSAITYSELMRLTSTGLGIGTSSPSTRLEVAGDASPIVRITSTSGPYSQIQSNTAGTLQLMADEGNTGASTSIRFRIDAAEVARFDSAGNLGIGTTSPTSASGYKFLTISDAGGANGAVFESISTGVTSRFFSRSSDGTSNIGTFSNHPLTFTTNSTERARIDSSGNLLVGTTSQLYGAAGSRLNVDAGSNGGATIKTSGGSAQASIYCFNSATSGDNAFISFGTEATWTSRGGITYNRAGGLVVYNTTSDYRAKDISGPVTDSGALIDSVPVYMGKMKWATEERPMFIAHETPSYAHTGVKDAVDADGNPVYQQMDASALIPVMWAEIQSLRQRVAQLETN